MKAIRMEKYGDAGVMKLIDDAPKPKPATGQVLPLRPIGCSKDGRPWGRSC